MLPGLRARALMSAVMPLHTRTEAFAGLAWGWWGCGGTCLLSMLEQLAHQHDRKLLHAGSVVASLVES